MNPFWNSEEKRLRSFLRLLIQYFLLFFSMPYVYTFCLFPLTPVLEHLTGRTNLEIIGYSAMFVSFVGSTWLCTRLIDRRSFADLGFRKDGACVDYAAGFIVSVVLVGVMLAIELLTGSAKIVRVNVAWLSDKNFVFGLADGMLTCLLVGVHEEVLRNYQIKNLLEGFAGKLGSRNSFILAVIVSSMVFAGLHLGNDNVTPLGVAMLFLAGVLFSLVYVLTGRGWWAFGLHAGWDLAEGNIFGFPVSGMKEECSLLTVQQTGADVITGGAFGPDGGCINLVMLVLGLICTLLFVRWRSGGKSSLQFKEDLAIYASTPAPIGVHKGL